MTNPDFLPEPDDDDEFTAPEYTVLSKQVIGGMAITTVIMDGEIEVFEFPLHLQDQAASIVDPGVRAERVRLGRLFDLE